MQAENQELLRAAQQAVCQRSKGDEKSVAEEVAEENAKVHQITHGGGSAEKREKGARMGSF